MEMFIYLDIERPYCLVGKLQKLGGQYSRYYSLLGVAKSEDDIYRILELNGFDDEYFCNFMRELCFDFGTIQWQQ